MSIRPNKTTGERVFRLLKILSISSLMMLTSFNTFALSNLHLVEEYSVVKSGEKREPQVIVFYENPNDSSRIIYEFCLTKKKQKCQILGNTEGVLKRELYKETKKHKLLNKILTPLQPVADIASSLALVYVAVQSGGTFAFIAGTGSVIAVDVIHNLTDPKIHKEFSDIFNPDSQGRFKLSGINIVDFSYKLEKMINRLSDYCNENPNEHKCILKRLAKNNTL